MPEIIAPNIPAMTMVRPILPAFTSSPWGDHRDHPKVASIYQDGPYDNNLKKIL